ncbi:hypothetical protein ACQPZP_38005 [Spirillospora sp. CA-142024]|uniref:hypothetical protein n=1 Tax=Spirillospora sp. CA-142024 TaxID=3240036 RepID=UPI003D8CDAC3
MSNGARHGLGVVIGLVVTPVIALCLTYGAGRLSQVISLGIARFETYHGKELWIGAGLFLVAAAALGLVMGSRLSPVASLVPGAAYTITGLVWFASPRWAITHPRTNDLPRELDLGYTTLASLGIFFLLGVMLVTASLAPSRWKARTNAAPRFGGPPPAPAGPPPMHGSPAPMGAHQPPPAPGQSPAWQGAPQYGQPPAQPAASNPPPLPPAEEKPKPSGKSGPDEDNPGEWTQMYGGNR